MSSGRARAMSSVYAVVEGKSEQAFAQQVLSVHLGSRDVFLEAALVGKPGHKGGNNWPIVRSDIINFIKMCRRRRVYVTTMFDYYAMPSDWPGREQARFLALANRAPSVEKAIAKDIGGAFGTEFEAARFIPYVQMHELEALILAEPIRLGQEFPDREHEARNLATSVEGLDPEAIDDGPTTSPSKRIIAEIPEYQGRKSSASANVLNLIGVDTLRTKCAHFAEWLGRLEQLGTES